MTLEEQLERAARARDVLENPAYLDAVGSLKTEIFEAWKTSPARDVDGRERLWLMLTLLGKLHLTLEARLDGGKMAEAQLNYKATLAERARAYLP